MWTQRGSGPPAAARGRSKGRLLPTMRRLAGVVVGAWAPYLLSPNSYLPQFLPASSGLSRNPLLRFRLRAAYFLRAEKVGKDALRGGRAGWDLRLRCAPGGDPYAPPPPRPPPFTGANTRTLALAAGAQDLAAIPFLRRPLRPDLADEAPPALTRRRLSAGIDGVGG